MSFSTPTTSSSSTGQVRVSSGDTTADYLIAKLIAGSNMTITQNNIGSNETLTFSSTGGGGGGGSFTVLTATGSIDDTNKTFSFSSAPSILSINGSLYNAGETSGGVVMWTLIGLVATLANPIGSGGSIFGITSSSSGGFEIPVGTINGSNKVFTVSHTPKYIIVDGVTYFENYGYTLSTLTITTDIAPVGFIKSNF